MTKHHKYKDVRATGRPAQAGAVGRPIHTMDPVMEHQKPPIENQTPAVTPGVPDELTGDRRFWPPDKPMPGFWPKTRRILNPCPACKRILLDNGGQASICTSSGNDVAFFKCKACGHNWQLGIREFG